MATRQAGAQPDFSGDLVQTITIARTGPRSVLLDPTWSHGQAIRLALRAVTAAGVGGPTTLLAPVVADAEAPADVNYLIVEQA